MQRSTASSAQRASYNSPSYSALRSLPSGRALRHLSSPLTQPFSADFRHSYPSHPLFPAQCPSRPSHLPQPFSADFRHSYPSFLARHPRPSFLAQYPRPSLSARAPRRDCGSFVENILFSKSEQKRLFFFASSRVKYLFQEEIQKKIFF